jgi:hypothetical protein
VNSLPEDASVLINHRIAIQDSVQVVKDYYINLLTPWVDEWQFELHAFGTEVRHPRDRTAQPDGNNDCGNLTLTAHYELESSPVSDTNDARFQWLAGTVKSVFGEDVIVAPELLTGRSRSDSTSVATSGSSGQGTRTHDITGIYRLKSTECRRGVQAMILEELACTPSMRGCPSKVSWRWSGSIMNSFACLMRCGDDFLFRFIILGK